YKHLTFTFTAMSKVRIRSDIPLFSWEDYSYIMQCHDIKPIYKILNNLIANRVFWDQPILHNDDNDSNQNLNILYNAQSVQVQSSISSHDVSISDNNSSNTNDIIYSKLSQNSNSLHAVKKNVSSNRNKVPCLKETLFTGLQSNNISRRKNDLKKLMKDTERLAPMLPSLS
ncbi:7626_t:CDS:2, partial [Cetraspora pellucida]